MSKKKPKFNPELNDISPKFTMSLPKVKAKPSLTIKVKQMGNSGKSENSIPKKLISSKNGYIPKNTDPLFQIHQRNKILQSNLEDLINRVEKEQSEGKEDQKNFETNLKKLETDYNKLNERQTSLVLKIINTETEFKEKFNKINVPKKLFMSRKLKERQIDYDKEIKLTEKMVKNSKKDENYYENAIRRLEILNSPDGLESFYNAKQVYDEIKEQTKSIKKDIFELRKIKRDHGLCSNNLSNLLKKYGVLKNEFIFETNKKKGVTSSKNDKFDNILIGMNLQLHNIDNNNNLDNNNDNSIFNINNENKYKDSCEIIFDEDNSHNNKNSEILSNINYNSPKVLKSYINDKEKNPNFQSLEPSIKNIKKKIYHRRFNKGLSLDTLPENHPSSRNQGSLISDQNNPYISNTNNNSVANTKRKKKKIFLLPKSISTSQRSQSLGKIKNLIDQKAQNIIDRKRKIGYSNLYGGDLYNDNNNGSINLFSYSERDYLNKYIPEIYLNKMESKFNDKNQEIQNVIEENDGIRYERKRLQENKKKRDYLTLNAKIQKDNNIEIHSEIVKYRQKIRDTKIKLADIQSDYKRTNKVFKQVDIKNKRLKNEYQRLFDKIKKGELVLRKGEKDDKDKDIKNNNREGASGKVWGISKFNNDIDRTNKIK